MEARPLIDRIVQRLRPWPEMAGLAAGLLDAVAPLTFLGAQALYVAEPLVGAFGGGPTLREFAGLLEDPVQVRALQRQLEEKA